MPKIKSFFAWLSISLTPCLLAHASSKPKTLHPNLDAVLNIPPALRGQPIEIRGTLEPDFAGYKCRLYFDPEAGFPGVKIIYETRGKLFDEDNFSSPYQAINWGARNKIEEYSYDGKEFHLTVGPQLRQSIHIVPDFPEGMRMVRLMGSKGTQSACRIDMSTLAKATKYKTEPHLARAMALGMTPETQSSPEFDKLASCGGSPIKKIDLSGQFPKTRQQSGGTCGDNMTTDLKIAAFKRNFGVAKDYSPQYLSCSGAMQEMKCATLRNERYQKMQNGKSFFDGCQLPIRMASALNTTQPPRGTFAEEKNQLDKVQASLHSDNPVLGTILWLTGKTESIESYTQKALDKAKVIDVSQEKMSSQLRIKSRVNPNPEYSSQASDFEKRIFDVQPSPGKLPNHTDLKKDMGASLGQIDRYLALQDFQNRHCSPENSEHMVREIMKHLCLGIPVGVAVLTLPDSHAMAAQGMEFIPDPVTHRPVPHLVFRNSWREGSKDDPKASVDYIPFSKACAIADYSIYFGPKDTDPDNCVTSKGRLTCGISADTVMPEDSH